MTRVLDSAQVRDSAQVYGFAWVLEQVHLSGEPLAHEMFNTHQPSY